MPRSAAAGENRMVPLVAHRAEPADLASTKHAKIICTDKGLQCLPEHVPALAVMKVQAEAHSARCYAQ